MTIVVIGIWLLISCIPYYSVTTYTWAASLKLVNAKSRRHMSIQAVSSVFFNSNHCINVIIYIIFYRDFRSSLHRGLRRLLPCCWWPFSAASLLFNRRQPVPPARSPPRPLPPSWLGAVALRQRKHLTSSYRSRHVAAAAANEQMIMSQAMELAHRREMVQVMNDRHLHPGEACL